MASETMVIPGNPTNWREFEYEDYDPAVKPGDDDDTLGELISERTDEDKFGIIVVADPVAQVSDTLIRRLSAYPIPTKIRRESRGGGKVGEKKSKKKSKDKD